MGGWNLPIVGGWGGFDGDNKTLAHEAELPWEKEASADSESEKTNKHDV